MTLSERLKQLRKLKGVKQEVLADIAHVSVRQYQNYEKGVSSPPFDVVLAYSELYGVTLDYLAGRTDDIEHELAFDRQVSLFLSPEKVAVLEKIIAERMEQDAKK